MEEIKIGAFYKHYNGGIYEVTDIVTDEETLAKRVIYHSTFDDKGWDKKEHLWFDTMFFDKNGIEVKRFTLVDPQPIKEVPYLEKLFTHPVSANEFNSFLLTNALRFLDEASLRNLGESILARVSRPPK